jgi:hypothetical protein
MRARGRTIARSPFNLRACASPSAVAHNAIAHNYSQHDPVTASMIRSGVQGRQSVMPGSVASTLRGMIVNDAGAVGRAERDTLWLSSALLGATLLLQRFGMPFSNKPISVVGPIGFVIAGIGLARGLFAFDRRRLFAYCVFSGWITIGMIWQFTRPNPFGVGADLQSLAQFLVLTSFAPLCFAHAVDERRFFVLVNRWFAFIAIAGIAQFFAQFVGISVFKFTGILPTQILYEQWYNVAIELGIGDIMKSNGFFMIEPSTFSQVMALAIVIELLTGRRPRYLALFAGGLMLSFSGTGWIVLASFALVAGLSLGVRGVLLAVGVVLLLAFTFGITFVLSQHMADAFTERLDEFSTMGTSAHLRFITPFWLLSDVLARAPSALWFGIGSGASERVYLPYLYNVNTPIKVALEYGLPALLAYLALFLQNQRPPAQRALVFPAMVLFLFAGGYQQFPPVLFLILLLLCTARLRPSVA